MTDLILFQNIDTIINLNRLPQVFTFFYKQLMCRVILISIMTSFRVKCDYESITVRPVYNGSIRASGFAKMISFYVIGAGNKFFQTLFECLIFNLISRLFKPEVNGMSKLSFIGLRLQYILSVHFLIGLARHHHCQE